MKSRKVRWHLIKAPNSASAVGNYMRQSIHPPLYKLHWKAMHLQECSIQMWSVLCQVIENSKLQHSLMNLNMFQCGIHFQHSTLHVAFVLSTVLSLKRTPKYKDIRIDPEAPCCNQKLQKSMYFEHSNVTDPIFILVSMHCCTSSWALPLWKRSHLLLSFWHCGEMQLLLSNQQNFVLFWQKWYHLQVMPNLSHLLLVLDVQVACSALTIATQYVKVFLWQVTSWRNNANALGRNGPIVLLQGRQCNRV